MERWVRYETPNLPTHPRPTDVCVCVLSVRLSLRSDDSAAAAEPAEEAHPTGHLWNNSGRQRAGRRIAILRSASYVVSSAEAISF